MLSVMREDKAGMQLFTWLVRVSNWQVDDLDLKMSPVISETSVNVVDED